MPHETLIVARDGPVLRSTMNRPEARNALSPVMVRELTQVFEQARDDADIRVVVLTGAGGTFCAGGDLKGMEELDAARRRRGGDRRLQPAVRRAAGDGRRAAEGGDRADRGRGHGRRRRPRRRLRLGDRREERADRHAGGDGRPRAGADRAVRGGAHRLHAGAAHGRPTACASMPRTPCASASCTRSPTAATISWPRAWRPSTRCCAARPRRSPRPSGWCAPRVREPLGPTLDAASHTFAAALAGDAREGIRAFVEKRKPAWAKKIERL